MAQYLAQSIRIRTKGNSNQEGIDGVVTLKGNALGTSLGAEDEDDTVSIQLPPSEVAS